MKKVISFVLIISMLIYSSVILSPCKDESETIFPQGYNVAIGTEGNMAYAAYEQALADVSD